MLNHCEVGEYVLEKENLRLRGGASKIIGGTSKIIGGTSKIIKQRTPL